MKNKIKQLWKRRRNSDEKTKIKSNIFK